MNCFYQYFYIVIYHDHYFPASPFSLNPSHGQSTQFVLCSIMNSSSVYSLEWIARNAYWMKSFFLDSTSSVLLRGWWRLEPQIFLSPVWGVVKRLPQEFNKIHHEAHQLIFLIIKTFQLKEAACLLSFILVWFDFLSSWDLAFGGVFAWVPMSMSTFGQSFKRMFFE